jgi:phospholipid/cholesterol/gamma-HCH transport system substrate-binding protein
MRERSEIAVGLTVLAALGIFLYSTFRIGACSLGAPAGVRLLAHFDDAAGVGPRTEVQIAGVEVGSVEAVALEEGRARLVLRLADPAPEVPIDSRVAIRSRGLLGERVVVVELGEDERLAADGDTLVRTREAPNLDAMLDNLATVSADIGEVARSLRVVMGGTEGEEMLSAIVGDVRSVTGQMRAFVEANEDRFARVVTNLDTVSGNLESFSTTLDRLATDDRSLETLLASFKSAAAQLEVTVGHLATVSERLERGEGTLGKLMKDEELYQRVAGSVAELQRTLTEVRRAAEETQEQLPVTVLGSVVGSLF